MLPKKDGFALARDIRKVSDDTPIIFLTAKSLSSDRIEGFRAGGDDYITKPFDMEELVLRIEAIMKRSKALSRSFMNKDSFELGHLLFNYKNHELVFGNESKSLTRKEAELLRLLCIHEGQVLERSVALDLVWGSDDYFLGRSMDVFISKLRKYLANDPAVQIINVHGIGFKLIVNAA
jgi:DNA-binding response OmpR family regulator